MKRLAFLLLGLLAVAPTARAQLGAGLGTKATEALKACFNTAQEWTCGGGALLTSDGTDVTLASGQLLLPNGTAGDPSWGWAADDDGTGTGMYRNAANSIGIANDGGLRWEFTNVHFKGLAAGAAQMRRDGGSVAAPPYAFVNEGTSGLYVPGAFNVGMTVGGALVMDWENTNAAGAGTDLVTISTIPGAMDGAADIVNMLLIDANGTPDHTGGNVFGINFDLQAADAQAVEAMIHGNDTWDYFIDADTALGTPSWTTNANKSGETAVGTIKVWINGTLRHIQLYADS